MPNMSYCRFENTLGDLEDCAEHITDANLSETEARARRRLIEVAANLLEEVGVEVDRADLRRALEDDE